MKLKEIYAGAPYEVQLKAPVLRIILITVLVLSPLVIAQSIILERWPSLVVFGLAAAFLGRFFGAGLLLTYVLTLAFMITGVLNGYNGIRTFLNMAALGSTAFILALIFSPSRLHLFVKVILYNGYYLGFIVWSFQTGLIQGEEISPFNLLVSPSAVILIISAAVVSFRGILDKVIQDSTLQLNQSLHRAQALGALVGSSGNRGAGDQITQPV